MLIYASYIEGGRLHLDDSSTGSCEIFAQAEAIAPRYKKIDLSDALQIVSIKHGKLKHGVNGSKTLLVTADRGLERAARKEGLRVWNCEDTPTPSGVIS
jgi:rRNA-processing protein FCF1